MKQLIALLFLALTLLSCSKESEPIPNNLQGQWILKEVICFCYFGDYDFGQNQLWIFADEKVLLAKGPPTDALNVTAVNDPATFTLKDQVIEVANSERSYSYEQKGDKLTLTYVDNPMIADDEITYVFERRQQDLSCMNLDQLRPDAPCTEEFMPVCGCDGVTYSNRCSAETYGGVTSFSDGACKN